MSTEIHGSHLKSAAPIPSLNALPKVKKKVREVLDLSSTLSISEKDIEVLNRKLKGLIDVIRKCLKSEFGSVQLVQTLRSLFSDLESHKLVNSVYSLNPLSLKTFERLSLVSQLVFLFANERNENMPGAVCHHWTLFWYDFWQECRKNTPFEKSRIYICQRTKNESETKYSYHSFLLLELERFYIMTTDGKKGITLREANNFSELGGVISRTVKSGDRLGLEKIRTFTGPRTFAQTLEKIPNKDLQLALALASGIEEKKV